MGVSGNSNSGSTLAHLQSRNNAQYGTPTQAVQPQQPMQQPPQPAPQQPQQPQTPRQHPRPQLGGKRQMQPFGAPGVPGQFGGSFAPPSNPFAYNDALAAQQQLQMQAALARLNALSGTPGIHHDNGDAFTRSIFGR